MQEFSAEPMSKKRRLCQYYGPEPSVEEIEGEFWRIVETPDEVGSVHSCLTMSSVPPLVQRLAYTSSSAKIRLCELHSAWPAALLVTCLYS